MEKVSNIRPAVAHVPHFSHEKKQQVVRAEIQNLFFQVGMSKTAIAAKLGVSVHTVIRWTVSLEQDYREDHRGWPRGVGRVHSAVTTQRIQTIHQELERSPRQFFTGATAIEQEWRRRYSSPPPSLRTIGRMLKALGLSAPRSRPRAKGAAAYLHYPEYTIYTGLGGRVLEADFIGKKYLAKHHEPIHFIGYSFKQQPILRHYQRVESETATVFMTETERFFSRFEVPDYVKVDNAAAMIGSSSGKRSVSRVVQFLLRHEVVPIFAVPRRPFSQASIEGSNSIFARKFWNARTFHSPEEIDRQLGWFNKSFMTYHGYVAPKRRRTARPFTPRVLFLRQVHARELDDTEGQIEVLNEEIILPASLINYFVVAQWNLETEVLTVSLERDRKLQRILKQRFPVNTPNLSF